MPEISGGGGRSRPREADPEMRAGGYTVDEDGIIRRRQEVLDAPEPAPHPMDGAEADGPPPGFAGKQSEPSGGAPAGPSLELTQTAGVDTGPTGGGGRSEPPTDQLAGPGAEVGTGVPVSDAAPPPSSQPPTGGGGGGAPAGPAVEFEPPSPGDQGAPATFESQEGQTFSEQGVETGEGRVASQAREFEQSIIESNKFITSPEAVAITREGDTLRASLTESGREEYRDLLLGEIESAQVAPENRLVQGGIGAASLFDERVDERRRQPENRLVQEGDDELPEWLTQGAVTGADQELVEGELEERAREQVLDQLEQEGVDTDDVFVDVDRTVGGFDVTVESSDQDVGDFPVRYPTLEDDDSFLEQEGQAAAAGTVGGFLGAPLAGDTAATIVEAGSDWLGIGGERAEDVLGDVGEDYSDALTEATAEGGSLDQLGVFAPGGAFAAGLEAAGQDEAAEAFLDVRRDVFRGSAAVLNVPENVLGIKEGVEYGIYGAEETAAGRGGEFLAETGEEAEELAQAGVRAFVENPVRTTSFVAGSLLGSTAILGAASRLGRGAGAAARYGIQPGEELLGVGGFRATRGLINERAAQRAFPNQEPLIFSEEAAIRGARGAARRVRGVEVDSELRDFFGAERAQLDLGRSRFEGESEVIEGEDLLDEQVSIDPEGQSRIGPEFDREEDLDPGDAFQRRRERLVEPETLEEPRGVLGDVRPGRAESRTTQRVRERRRQAQRPFYETEQEDLLGGTRRAETSLVGPEEPLVSDADLAAAEASFQQDLASDLATEGDLLAEPRAETDLWSESLVEAESWSESLVETEQETRFDTELETETELWSELETEQEVELEAELLLEPETEVEAEPFLFEDGREEDEELDWLYGSETFSTGFLDVDSEDIWGGAGDGFGEMSDEDIWGGAGDMSDEDLWG